MRKTFITLVVGARPNFMKIAPIIRALNKYKKHFSYRLVHTGQHLDKKMNSIFFDELGIPSPDSYLKGRGGSSLEEISRMIVEFERDCLDNLPQMVLVVGDVNSTLACSLVAKKLNLKLIHVEAGLRSGDKEMPEEINRIIIDSVTDLFFVTEPSAFNNLINEGHNSNKIHFVGNVMIDNLFYQKEKLNNYSGNQIKSAQIKEKYKEYAVVTLHRPSNVDHEKTFKGIVMALNKIALKLPLIFPVHPRTRVNIKKYNLKFNNNILLIEPLSYINFLNLWKDSKLVLTDSGGLQEETSALGVNCITIRENTERPITLEQGTNTLSGVDPKSIINIFNKTFVNREIKAKKIKFWDGMAAERIAKSLIVFNDE
ncbi:non-hydrolyzing UDP-N-acetylglucosamine 2-epimerase [Pseudothioglobus sp. nBUS_23]|uniref:non-hydrolyzing UDP-N-acetylglucosamine 2-epimerase n=1 Tax=Pseudothioglobus sp. nBUS_23 TaxID=3395318 RepID=UPI003EBBD105